MFFLIFMLLVPVAILATTSLGGCWHFTGANPGRKH
jgi:hypothetical protein